MYVSTLNVCIESLEYTLASSFFCMNYRALLWCAPRAFADAAFASTGRMYKSSFGYMSLAARQHCRLVGPGRDDSIGAGIQQYLARYLIPIPGKDGGIMFVLK